MLEKRYGRIAGWGAYTPARILTNADLSEMLDTSDEWIVQRSGIHQRRIAAPGETTATMAINAGRAALEKAGLSGSDLDLIVVATSSPDYLTPPVSSQVQHALGAPGLPAFTLSTGCTGFVFALSTAYQFIATGAYQTILVVGVEMLSRHLNWQDRSTAVLFGDAAGAVVVQATAEPCGLHGFLLGSDGSQFEHIIVPAGGSAEPFTPEAFAQARHTIHMNGQAVFKFASRMVGTASRQVLAQAGLGFDDIAYIIPHQANRRIIEAAARDLGLPLDRFIINIERYGNTSAASIPLALSEALDEGKIKPQDTVLLVTFGAGLTWAAAVLQLQPIHRPPLSLNGSHAAWQALAYEGAPHSSTRP
jgi:3-oxoacyl-[acyl-carrier-protein] synthase-3